MIAKDCVFCVEQECDDYGSKVPLYYYCTYYLVTVTNCGDGCPKYDCKDGDENIKKFWEGK